MRSIINLIARVQKLEKEIHYLKQIITNAPEGRLIIRKEKELADGYRYTNKIILQDGSVKEIYLGKKDMETAVQLADRMYAEKKILDLQTEKHLLERMISFRNKKTHAEQFLESHVPLQQILSRSLQLKNEQALAWKNAPYRRNQKYPEGLIYPTVIRDLKVRSKAEADIVSRYEYYGVPYHYEEIITINGVDYAMDFTCLNVQAGKLWYWDHRGMADDPDYIRKTLACENAFMNAGIIQGINLIVTTETREHPLDLQWVDELIQYYLI